MGKPPGHPDPGKIFEIFALDSSGVYAVDVGAVEEGVLKLEGVDEGSFGCCFNEAVADPEARVLLFTKLEDVADTDPKDCTTFTAGVAAGDKTSSIDPKPTDPGRTTDPTLFRGTDTPSLMDTPCPNALGRLE